MNEQTRKPTRKPTDGVALATIVAKETTHGMSGTKSDQTELARELKGPEKPSFNYRWYVFGPSIALMGAGIIFAVAPSVFSLLDTGAPTTRAVAPMVYVSPVMVVLSVGYLLFFSSSRWKQAYASHVEEKQRFEIIKAIYHRLRYVENDHVVFDPITMKEVQADKRNISNLLEELALSEVVKR